jgi:hypothetical protein
MHSSGAERRRGRTRRIIFVGRQTQPVPFFYVHLLYLISFVYLPLFAFLFL